MVTEGLNKRLPDPLTIGYILTALFTTPVVAFALYITFMTGGQSRFSDAAQVVAGWLTPLALCWFVATVLLQPKELEAQREELRAARKEHMENRIASEKHAEAMDASSKTQQKSLLINMISSAQHAFLYDAASIRTYIEYTRSIDTTNVVPLATIDQYSMHFLAPEKLYREVMSSIRSWGTQQEHKRGAMAKYGPKIRASVKYSPDRGTRLLKTAKVCDMGSFAHDTLVNSPLGSYLNEIQLLAIKPPYKLSSYPTYALRAAVRSKGR